MDNSIAHTTPRLGWASASVFAKLLICRAQTYSAQSSGRTAATQTAPQPGRRIQMSTGRFNSPVTLVQAASSAPKSQPRPAVLRTEPGGPGLLLTSGTEAAADAAEKDRTLIGPRPCARGGASAEEEDGRGKAPDMMQRGGTKRQRL
jgi:hypothetical protein